MLQIEAILKSLEAVAIFMRRISVDASQIMKVPVKTSFSIDNEIF